MSYSSEIISPQKCFLKVSRFHCVLNPHGIIFSFTKSWAIKKKIIKPGVSQWDSPTFVWFLLREHYNMLGLFEWAGEMLVFTRSWVSPETWESGEGKCGFSGCTSDPFIPSFVYIGGGFPSFCPIMLFVPWLLPLRICCFVVNSPVPWTCGLSSILNLCILPQMAPCASVSPTVMSANQK